MLTIFQDWIVTDKGIVEHAYTDQHEVFADSGATRSLARLLIEEGYRKSEKISLVRANPWLFPAPHRISPVTLETASKVDFFKDCPKSIHKELQLFQDVVQN